MDLAKFTTLKAKASQLRQDAARAQGVIDGLMSRLKDEFGCGTLKAAERMAADLKKQQEEIEESLASEMKSFEDQYGCLLAEDEDG